MADQILEAESARVINLSEYRQQKSGEPDWANDIKRCCTYARLLKADHAAERARLDYELLFDHADVAWWDAPADIQARVNENNRLWNTYIALLEHIASIPAVTRSHASIKRATIGRMWLKPDGSRGPFKKMREGCLADDHLFPPSLKLARVKGPVRVS